jgi:hypothetical protein
MQATEALLEARKFDAFNRMSAFVVHDLKNIVTQLSLMLKNAQRLHDNPEFQQDMLLTVESSLEKMRRLMLQLREGATPPGGARGVDMAPWWQAASDGAAAGGSWSQVRRARWPRAATKNGSNAYWGIWCRTRWTPRRPRPGMVAGRAAQRAGARGSGRHGKGMTRTSSATACSAPSAAPSTAAWASAATKATSTSANWAGPSMWTASRASGTVMRCCCRCSSAQRGSDLAVPRRMSTRTPPPLLIVEDDLALQKQIKWSLDRFES